MNVIGDFYTWLYLIPYSVPYSVLGARGYFSLVQFLWLYT